MPEFLKIIIAVLAGLAADPVRSAITTAIQAKGMRRSLYFELAHFHHALYSAVNSVEPNKHLDAEYLRTLKPDVYKHARSKPDVFYSLPDAVAFDQFYRMVEFMIEQAKTDANVLSFAEVLLGGLDMNLKAGRLNDDMLREVSPEYSDYKPSLRSDKQTAQ